MVLINAESETSAVRALKIHLGLTAGVEARARGLYDAMRLQHGQISRFLASGIGLKLMRVDSGLMEAVLLRMLLEGVPPLSIHDSTIVPIDAADCVAAIMEDELQRTLHELRRAA